MKFTEIPYEYTNPLVNKYLNNFNEVSSLFEYNPFNTKAFEERYNTVMLEYRTDRHELVKILKEYNETLGCGAETLSNIESLKDSGTVVIVTGQQAGVLTGPLYTIYKAVTAIQVAKETASRLGKKVVPMFWVAAEDHDYAEVDHLDLLNREQEVGRLRLNYTPDGKYPVGHIPVTDAVYDLLEELEASTNPSQWKDEMLSVLKQLAEQSGNLADWFAAVMTWLFNGSGLVMINPLNLGLRRLWSGTFGSFLQQADRVNEKLLAGMEKVRGLGAVPQVEKEPHNINMFLLVEGERMALQKKGEQYEVRGGNRVWSFEELLEIAEAKPELLSPNVVLRPVAQDVLLPIMAYIAGPGEISYYALYREIYPLFGQTMPIIFPRTNITIMERSTVKHMDKYRVNFSDGPEGIAEKLNEYLAKQDIVGIDSIFENYTGELQKSYEAFIENFSIIDPDLRLHGRESLNKIIHQVSHFKRKVSQSHRKSCDLAIKRFRNIENQLFPKKSMQERVFNIFPYLFKYGPDFVKEIIKTPLILNARHKLLYPGAEEKN